VATFEPYVLWRLAPGNFGLSETVGRGHLNEVTIGLHVKGTLPADFDYDTEFDGQKGSLGAASIGAWTGYAGIGKAFSESCRRAAGLYRGQLRLWNEKSGGPRLEHL